MILLLLKAHLKLYIFHIIPYNTGVAKFLQMLLKIEVSDRKSTKAEMPSPLYVI